MHKTTQNVASRNYLNVPKIQQKSISVQSPTTASTNALVLSVAPTAMLPIHENETSTPEVFVDISKRISAEEAYPSICTISEATSK